MIAMKFFAILLVALSSLTQGAHAQTAYRCADSYSQAPCPGGVAIDAADSRSNSQKAQTDAATARDIRTAESLEKSRLKQEAIQARAATKTSGKQAAPQKPASRAKAGSKRNPKKPAPLTAQIPGEKKKTEKENRVQAAQR